MKGHVAFHCERTIIVTWHRYEGKELTAFLMSSVITYSVKRDEEERWKVQWIGQVNHHGLNKMSYDSLTNSTLVEVPSSLPPYINNDVELHVLIK